MAGQHVNATGTRCLLLSQVLMSMLSSCQCFATALPDNDTLEEKAFGTAIFGVMYTVCKEKSRYSWFFIGARLLADWLQL
jgi:hypothetical protein